MLPCIPFLLLLMLSAPTATVIKQTTCGIVGQPVFLHPEYLGDLNKNGILWTFHHGDKNSVTIVDYLPGQSTEYPYRQFKSRLQYNTSNGGLQIWNLRLEDRGNFTFRVAGQEESILELIVIKPITTNILCTSGKSVFFPGIQESEKCSAIKVRWQKISENIKIESRANVVWQSLTGSSEPAISQNYKGRINYDLSNASFILQNIISGDKGVYQLSIIQPEIIVQTVQLIIMESSWKEMMSIGALFIALVLYVFYLGAFFVLRWKKPNQDYKGLIVCTILYLVFDIIGLSLWINIKDDVFPPVVALCYVSFWVLTMITVFVPKLHSLIERVFHLSKGFTYRIGLFCSGVIPLSIVILKEAIQQNNQRCQTYNLTWIFVVSLAICCMIIFCVCFAMCYRRKKNTSNEHDEKLQCLNDVCLDPLKMESTLENKLSVTVNGQTV